MRSDALYFVAFLQVPSSAQTIYPLLHVERKKKSLRS